MPRIPTYTASLTTPQQRTAEELSVSSAQQPGAALQGLGQQLQRAGAVGMDISAQIMREKELRFAADANQRFTEESIKWQQENGNREDSGEAFKTWSDQRIQQLSSEAPNGRGAEAFKIHVTPQANSDWQRNLARSEQVRLSNYKVGEEAASQSSQEAFRFRFNQGNPDAEPIRTQDLKNQIVRNDAAYGTVAPAHAQAMNESAVVSAVLGAAEHSPAFARKLLNEFPLVDVPKRETLLNHIEAKEESMGVVERYNTQRAWEAQRNAAWETLTPLVATKDYAIFGRHAETERNQQTTQDKITNEAIMAFSSVSDKNANAQQSALAEYDGSDDPDKRAVGSMLAARIEQSRQLQSAAPHLWLVRENQVVQEAQTEWEGASADAVRASDADRPALLAKARAYRSVLLDVSTHFQGAPPPGADSSYYLFRNSGEIQVVTPTEAQTYADEMVKGGAETADQAMMAFSASFPPEHLGTAWGNLSTLPKDGHKLPVNWQFDSTIVDPIVRKRFLGASKFEKDIGALTDERKKNIDAAFNNDTWKTFARTMAGDNYQRSGWVESAKQAITADAIGLMFKNPSLSEKAAIKQSLEQVISAQFHSTSSANGQALMVPVQRTDWTTGEPAKPPRTNEELDHAPTALQMSLLRLPTNLIPTSSLNWLSDVDKTKRGDPEVEAMIQKYIVQSARWQLEPDGQSYSLYVYDARQDNSFQLLDNNGRPFVVPLDKAVAEQSKDVVTRRKEVRFGEGPMHTREADTSGPRAPSEVPPVFRRSHSLAPEVLKFWQYTSPLKAAAEPWDSGIIENTTATKPVLGGEWINQQPGNGPKQSIERVKPFVDPSVKPPAKPKK